MPVVLEATSARYCDLQCARIRCCTNAEVSGSNYGSGVRMMVFLTMMLPARDEVQRRETTGVIALPLSDAIVGFLVREGIAGIYER